MLKSLRMGHILTSKTFFRFLSRALVPRFNCPDSLPQGLSDAPDVEAIRIGK